MKNIIPFSKLPKPQQRVEIAKDTIKWVLAGAFKPKSGYYLRVTLPNELQSSVDEGQAPVCDMQLNKLINENKKVICNVCAKGGMFMAHVMKNNHFTLKDSQYANDNRLMKKRLEQFFSSEQLDLIETAFEKKYIFYEDHLLYDDFNDKQLGKGEKKVRRECRQKAKNAIAFGRRYKKPSDRMIAIMKNVIKNKGIFNP